MLCARKNCPSSRWRSPAGKSEKNSSLASTSAFQLSLSDRGWVNSVPPPQRMPYCNSNEFSSAPHVGQIIFHGTQVLQVECEHTHVHHSNDSATNHRTVLVFRQSSITREVFLTSNELTQIVDVIFVVFVLFQFLQSCTSIPKALSGHVLVYQSPMCPICATVEEGNHLRDSSSEGGKFTVTLETSGLITVQNDLAFACGRSCALELLHGFSSCATLQQIHVLLDIRAEGTTMSLTPLLSSLGCEAYGDHYIRSLY